MRTTRCWKNCEENYTFSKYASFGKILHKFMRNSEEIAKSHNENINKTSDKH